MAETMLCIKDFERHAKKHMNKITWSYYSGGSEREVTLNDNEAAFRRYKFIPRMLCNVDSRDLSVTVLGDKISFPVGLAPTAYQRMAHDGGEIAAAKAASRVGTVYTVSTFSNTPMEELAAACGGQSPLWMQTFLMKERDFTRRMIQKAEKWGFRALVLTIDTPVVGLQLKAQRTEFSLLPHLRVPNVEDALPPSVDGTVKLKNMWPLVDSTITWNDITWVRSVTKLPLVLKGVLTGEDARLAVQHGVSAIWVSNHGGRQLDGTLATIDALSEVVSAVEGKVEVYMDGGIRWGSDVLKALALGARAVFIGRPAIYGLSHNGEEGVKSVLEILRRELEKAMALSGCQSIDDIKPSLLTKVPASRI